MGFSRGRRPRRSAREGAKMLIERILAVGLSGKPVPTKHNPRKCQIDIYEAVCLLICVRIMARIGASSRPIKPNRRKPA